MLLRLILLCSRERGASEILDGDIESTARHNMMIVNHRRRYWIGMTFIYDTAKLTATSACATVSCLALSVPFMRHRLLFEGKSTAEVRSNGLWNHRDTIDLDRPQSLHHLVDLGPVSSTAHGICDRGSSKAACSKPTASSRPVMLRRKQHKHRRRSGCRPSR